jgi:hypothetical protein
VKNSTAAPTHTPRSNLLRPKPKRMDHLGGYGSSSDEEDQSRTTIAMPTPVLIPLKVNPSKEEIWSKRFQEIKEFYEEKGHLIIPRNDPESLRLGQWLTYQRHQYKALRKDQLERLESVNYNTVSMHRQQDENEWQVKYNRLKQCYDEAGGGKIKVKDRALSCWLSRQKRCLRNNVMDPTRQEMLGKLGINFSTLQSCGRKTVKSQELEEKWQSQLEKLKEYRRLHGDCNVPQQWKEDRSLGTWVVNQRKKYKHMKTGVADMDPDRIQKLEHLGFEWSWYDSKRMLKRKACSTPSRTAMPSSAIGTRL